MTRFSIECYSTPEECTQAKLRDLYQTQQIPNTPNARSYYHQESAPGYRRFWFLPHIEPPYPLAVKQRQPMIDPETYVYIFHRLSKLYAHHSSITLTKSIDRLTIQFSWLSLSDRLVTPSKRWSRLERLPPELVLSISEHLVFFDKKALASTSERMYHLLGDLRPPDRFAWRAHLVTSFNRVSGHYFDVTILPPHEIKQELARIWRQVPLKPKFTHFNINPTKSRLDDLNCIYFPAGYATEFWFGQIRCRTLGQFLAIQFYDYVHRIVKECSRRQDLARRRRRVRADYSEEHTASISREITKWEEVREQCFKGAPYKIDQITVAPTSANAGSMEFMTRMGYEVLCNRVCMFGRICEVDVDEGVRVGRVPKAAPSFTDWYALDELDEEVLNEDDSTDQEPDLRDCRPRESF
ncbi:MAG: hypothetical protein Q9207_003348 [Kuettlingeria erythrocarpa]